MTAEAPDRLHVPARLLVAAGEALYGEEWQSALARRLGHNTPRTVQRWAEAARRDDTYLTARSLLEQLLGMLERKVGQVQTTFDLVRTFHDENS